MSLSIAHKKTIATDITIEVIPPSFSYYGLRTYSNQEEYFTCVQRWAEELQGFLQEHSKYREAYIIVHTKKSDVYSACNHEWEPYTDSDGTFCINCGAEITLTKEEEKSC